LPALKGGLKNVFPKLKELREKLASLLKGGSGDEFISTMPSGGDFGAKTWKPWQITREGTDKVMSHRGFGKFYRSKSDGLWWSKDLAGHGGSSWKVYEETGKGLKWIGDADEYGNFIVRKHKGDVGKEINWKDLKGSEF
ncbi:MAG: hypothetical protein ACLGG7_13620, partial [Bacteriovoracia bacterium]